MIAAAAERGWLDRRRALTESTTVDPPRRRRVRDHLRRGRPRDLDPGDPLMSQTTLPGGTAAPGLRRPAARPSFGRPPTPCSRAASTARSAPSRGRARTAHRARPGGARVRDADGREYLDYMSSWGPAILGHAASGGGRGRPRRGHSTAAAFGATEPAARWSSGAIREAMPSIERMRFVAPGPRP